MGHGNFTSYLTCRAREPAFPSKPVLNTGHKYDGTGLVSKALGAALSKVMAEIRATGSLQVTLHSEGNVWSL